MIITCRNCQRDYDSSNMAEGNAIRCECGDIIMITDSSNTDGAKLVRAHIARLSKEEGVDITIAPDATAWELHRGSATIRLRIDSERNEITAMSTVIPLPLADERQLQLFRRVLELNAKVSGDAKFAVSGEDLIVMFSRSIIGLDYVEFHSGLEDVCRVADDYDDILREEFLSGAPTEQEDEEIDLSSYSK